MALHRGQARPLTTDCTVLLKGQAGRTVEASSCMPPASQHHVRDFVSDLIDPPPRPQTDQPTDHTRRGQIGHCIAFDAAAAMMARAVSACFALAHCYALVSSFRPHTACADRRRSPSLVHPPPPPPPPTTSSIICRHMIGTGFNYDDGDQILVSAQKPLGIILEEKEEGVGKAADVSWQNSPTHRRAPWPRLG